MGKTHDIDDVVHHLLEHRCGVWCTNAMMSRTLDFQRTPPIGYKLHTPLLGVYS